MRRHLLHLLAGLLLGYAPAWAQTSTQAVPLNTPFTVVISHDGAGGPTAFRLYLDGAKVGNDIPAAQLQNGEVRVAHAGLSVPGAHTFEATALNDAGESPRTAGAVWAGPPPKPGLRFTITTTTAGIVEPQPDGTFTVRFERSETIVKGDR